MKTKTLKIIASFLAISTAGLNLTASQRVHCDREAELTRMPCCDSSPECPVQEEGISRSCCCCQLAGSNEATIPATNLLDNARQFGKKAEKETATAGDTWFSLDLQIPDPATHSGKQSLMAFGSSHSKVKIYMLDSTYQI